MKVREQSPAHLPSRAVRADFPHTALHQVHPSRRELALDRNRLDTCGRTVTFGFLRVVFREEPERERQLAYSILIRLLAPWHISLAFLTAAPSLFSAFTERRRYYEPL
jgi:hypothetical protein